MTHSVLALLHHVAAQCRAEGYTHVALGEHCAAIPDARRIGLVESPERGRGELDHYWLRLTPKGRRIVDEQMVIGREMIGDG